MRIEDPPTFSVRALLLRVTDSTDTLLTVTTQFAEKPDPSAAVAVMIAVPGPTAVTVPFTTIATLELLVDQITFLLSAVTGPTSAVRIPDPPTWRLMAPCMSIDVTRLALTVTTQFAVLVLPRESVTVTVITAVPADTPVTFPSESTMATAGLLEVQDTVADTPP